MTTSLFSRRSSSYSQVAIDDGDDTSLPEHNKRNQIEEHSGVTPTFRIDDDGDDGDDDDDDDDLEEQPLTPTTTSTTSSSTTTLLTITVPSNYICPLTLHPMREPVNDGCGHCFEREAIVEWLEYHEMCPISRKPLHRSHLHPADALRVRIRRWRESHYSYSNSNHILYNHNPERLIVGDGGDEVVMMESSSSSSGTRSTSDDDDDDDDDHSTTAAPGQEVVPVPAAAVEMESLLLPQEHRVLQIIKVRARDRRSRRDVHNCLWALVFTAAIVLCVASILAIKFFEMELIGPI
jgi:hypothetical protein